MVPGRLAVTGAKATKYAVVECIVVRHQHYGLMVQLGTGDKGFVDQLEIADFPMQADEWPAVGDRIRAVVLGSNQDGRLRLSARRRDIVLIESSMDPASALEEWQRVKNSDSSEAELLAQFYRSSNARALLRWALSHDPSTAEYMRAREVLSLAPDEIREGLE